MRKSIFFGIAFFGLLLGTSNKASAQVEEGTFLIDPYVGAPTWNFWWGNTDLEGFFGSDYTDYRTVGSPVSFGGRLEYMVADNFGIGLDGHYAPAGFQLSADNPDDTLIGVFQTARYEANRLRIMLRVQYHFVQTENLDVYLGVGAGYRRVTRTLYWDGAEDPNSNFSLLSGSAQPVAVRVGIGVRYHFIPNLGVHIELGAPGGGVIQGGISVKI